MPARRTERRDEILAALRVYIAAHGYAPTIAELREATGLSSNSSVVYQLDRLAEAGVIRRDPYTPRAIVLLTAAEATP